MRRALMTVAVLALVGACARGGSPDPNGSSGPEGRTGTPVVSPASPSLSSSWPTYHGNVARTGDAGAGVPALRPPLRVGWSARLDAAVYASPILVGSATIVATENDTVYALDVVSGQQRWHRNLGSPARLSSLPCGNIDPLGITGTPAYDSATGSVFAVAQTSGGNHTLYSLSASDGTVRWHRSMDVLAHRDRRAAQQRAALLVTAGRVVVAFGGLYGDCGNYVGYVTSTPTNGVGATTTYAVPTSRQAGIWAAGGPAVGADASILVSVGNGAATGGRWDGSDSVLALDPVTLHRKHFFAPTGWPADNASDLDLGSMAPLPVAGGRVLIAGKRGTAYLLPPGLGGFGGQLAAAQGCTAFGGGAVRGALAVLPCTGGVRAVAIGAASLTWGWQAPGIPGSPVLAGPAVYVLDPGSRTFYELALSSGQVLGAVNVGAAVTRFATPTVAAGGRLVLVPTTHGVVALRGR